MVLKNSKSRLNKLVLLTVEYLEADSGQMLNRQRDLEEFLRAAGNSEAQAKFWMGFCLDEDDDEDGDLRSSVMTGAVLSALQGYLVV